MCVSKKWESKTKMSDDDEPQYKRSKTLHYGSLEEQERKRLANPESTGSLASDAIQAGVSAGNINLTEGRQSLNPVTVAFLCPEQSGFYLPVKPLHFYAVLGNKQGIKQDNNKAVDFNDNQSENKQILYDQGYHISEVFQ